MKLSTRVGVFLTASLLACGSVSAAHATVDDQPVIAPSELNPTTTETSIGDNEPPAPDEAESLVCQEHVNDTAVTIHLETTVNFDELTVTDGATEITQKDGGDTSSVVIDRAEAASTMVLTLWDDKSLVAECEVNVQPLPAPEESEPSDSSPPDPDEPTVPPEPSDPDEPTVPPAPSDPDEPTVPPAPSDPDEPTEPPALSEPPLPYTPSEPAPSNDYEQQSQAPTSLPDQPVSRNIRPNSDSPRHLLPQFFGINSHRGSPLIMPHPRDGEQQPTSFETLPPISEDELDAIKAQLASPGRADHSTTTDELQSAEIDDRIVNENSWWLLAGMTAVVCVGVGAWWALSKRKRRH